MSTNNNIVSTGFITIVDLSDPVISSTEPPSPVEDMLWMDTSVTPPVLKIYKSGSWTPISDVGSSTPDTITTGGYFKGDLIINKNATGLDSNGDVQVKGGSFVHPNGGTFTIPSNKYIVTNLNRGEGRNRYIVFIGHDSSRFSFLSDNESRHFIAATYKDKQWYYYINGIQTPFTPGDNDCIVAKVEENTNINSLKRIIKYYENQDSVFEALTEGGTIQGIYKKDGMLFISAELVSTGKLRSANGTSEFDLDNGSFRLGGTSSTDYKMKFDGTDLYFANGAIKWENLDGNAQENLRNVTVSIIDGVRSVTVNANNEIQTDPTVYRAKVMLGTDDITNSCSLISWTASGIYTGNASGSTFIPSKGTYTTNESYVEVVATYKGKQFKDRIGISVSKQGATGVQGPAGADGKTYYTWIKYANDASGNGMSNLPDGKTYIGMAYNKETAVESSNASDYTWSLIQGPQGIQGPAGSNGQTYYTWLKYADTPTSGMSDSPDGKKYMGLAYNKTTATESTNYGDYTWSLIRGEDGKSIINVDVEYAVNSSPTSAPTSGWQTTTPTWVDGQYIWSRTKTTYSSGDPSYTNPACITGGKGQTGSAGKGVSSTVITYQVSTSGTTTPTGTWTSSIPSVPAGQYLWTRTVINYTDNTSSTSYSIGKMGEQGATGNAGKGVKSTAITYQASTSGTTTPTGTWSSTVPTVSAGQYLWTKTVITYTDETTSTSYSIGKMGEQGPQGNTGATGTGIESITELYKMLSTKEQQPTPTSDSGWTTTPPTWSSGMYIHTCSKIVYKNPSSTVYTTPICDSSWEAVNEIEIGGRNLLLKSDTTNLSAISGHVGSGNASTVELVDDTSAPKGKAIKISKTNTSGTPNGGRYFIVKEKLTVGKTYSWSFYAKGTGTLGTTGPEQGGTRTITLTSEYQRMTHTFIATDKSNYQFVFYGTGVFEITFHSIKLETGNKATDWSPAPEDISNSISEVSGALSSLDEELRDAFGDSIINDSEANAIASNIQVLNSEKLNIDKEYSTVYGNSKLGGTAKTNLASAKTAYDSAHTGLISGINSAIADKVITRDDRNSIDILFAEYNEKLGTYKQRLQEALDYISTAKVDDIEIGGRNYISDSKNVYMKPNGTSNYDLTFDICDSFWENQNRFGVITLSFDVQPDSALAEDFSSNVWFRASPWHSFNSWTYPKGTTEKRHYTLQVSLKSMANTYKTTQLFVRFQSKDTIGMRFTNVKMEVSNKPTDWTPAPEDVEAAIGENIANVDVMYYLSTSATSVTGGSWSTTAPAWVDGKYMWSKTVTTLANGTSKESSPTCIAGATGSTGKGVQSIVEQYYSSTSATSLTGGTWTTAYPGWSQGKYIWTRSVTTYTDGSSSTTTAICVSGSTGATGPQGPTGATGSTGPQGPAGVSVTSVDVEYAIHTSATSAPTSGWQTTSPTWVDGKYIWSRTKTTYSSGSPTYTNPACITGGKGATGSDGKGVSSTTVTYQASTSGTTTPTGSWSSTVPTVSAGQYLWTKTVITYTDNTSTTFYSIGKMGEQGPQGPQGNTGATGATGKGVKSTAVTYQASTSGTTTPTGTWNSTVPTVSAGQYLWTKTVITYTDDTSTTFYSIGKMGEQGPQGATGATGTGVTSITEEYYLSTSKTSQTGGSWTTTPPTWSSGMYIWTRSKIIYNNPTSTVYTTPICDSSWEAVNGIQIGGRNLFKGTKNFSTGKGVGVIDTTEYNNLTVLKGTVPSSGYSDICQWTNLSILPNTEYTLSFYAKASVSGTKHYSYLYPGTVASGVNSSGGTTTASDGAIITTLTTEWERYWVTWKTVSSISGAKSVIPMRVLPSLASAGVNTYICGVKFEIGNKPTDWCLALEETVSSVDTMYYLSTSSTTQAGGSWTTTLPAITANKFIWTKTVTTYAAGNTLETTPILYQPEWIQDWGGTQTTIGGTSVLSPKIFAGTKDLNGYATGVAMGVNIFGEGSNFSGLAGYQNGVKSYHFKTDGTFLIGKDTVGNHISWNGDTLSIKGNIKGSNIEGSTFLSSTTQNTEGFEEDSGYKTTKYVKIQGQTIISSIEESDDYGEVYSSDSIIIQGGTIKLSNYAWGMAGGSYTEIDNGRFVLHGPVKMVDGPAVKFNAFSYIDGSNVAEFDGKVKITQTLNANSEIIAGGGITGRSNIYISDIAGSNVAGGQNNTATTRVTDLNKIWKSGFYDCDGGANIPFAGWNWVIHAGHTNNNSGGAYNYGLQIAAANGTNLFGMRTVNASGSGSWNTLYHTGNKPTPAAIGAYAWSEWNTWKDTNGYAKLPTGIILQWGYTTVAPAAPNTVTSSTVYFPVSFPNSCRYVNATPRSTVPDRLTTTSCIASSNSSFDLYMARTNTTETGYVWFAIGY